MKYSSESYTEQTHILRYQHLNGQRRLFGGTLMQWIDELAGIVAYKHSGAQVITAAVDSLVFKQPAFLNDLIVMAGRITYTGNSSMEVRVDTWALSIPGDGQRRLINTAYLVMVATDELGAPRPVPALKPQTEDEQQEWAAAQQRHALRKQRRAEE